MTFITVDTGSTDLERLAGILEGDADYRVLRRLNSSWLKYSQSRSARFGIFLDVETTGLDHTRDGIVELAMLPFDYALDGRITAVGDPFVGMQDPGIPIPTAVTTLTGITGEMVAGKEIDPADVTAFVESAAIIIAHNAAFDRRFCERAWPIFSTKPWGCSFREVAWAEEGFEGARLCHVAAKYGFFFDGHRAVDDCRAGVEILSRLLPRTARPCLGALLESARRPLIRLQAVNSPFDLREKLKARGYRWSGEAGRKAWFIDVAEADADAEIDFLKREIYRRDDADVHARQLTAWDRYSERE